tara:strand:+ start:675 stop:1586 length:912 start_codon:yes stop_codon:yes gene_type:complete
MKMFKFGYLLNNIMPARKPRPAERRRRTDGSGRRKTARPPSPQQVISQFDKVGRRMRDLMRQFHTLRKSLGIRNVSAANIVRLKKSWKGQPTKLRKLNQLLRIRLRYSAALKESTWSRRILKLRLVRDPKFVQIGNLAAFTHEVFKIVRKCGNTGKPCAMSIVDIDKFKRVNDSFGHGVGDVVINELATQLKNFATAHGGTAARVGGEEFRVFVAMSGPQLSTELEKLQQSFSRVLSNPKTFGVDPIKTWSGWTTPTFSAGISVRKSGSKKQKLDTVVGALATKSDAALYKAKETRNSVKVHK